MRTIKTDVYLFNELNKDVQEKLIKKRNSKDIYDLMYFAAELFKFKAEQIIAQKGLSTKIYIA